MTELIAARRRMAIFLGLFLFIVVLLTSQARSPDRRQVGAIGTAVLTVLLPVQAGMARIADGAERMWELYTEIGRLRVENARLRGEVEALSRKMAELREEAAAAQRLERLLELRSQTAYRSLAAHVGGRDVSRWVGTLLVDRGSRGRVAYSPRASWWAGSPEWSRKRGSTSRKPRSSRPRPWTVLRKC